MVSSYLKWLKFQISNLNKSKNIKYKGNNNSFISIITHCLLILSSTNKLYLF